MPMWWLAWREKRFTAKARNAVAQASQYRKRLLAKLAERVDHITHETAPAERDPHEELPQ